MIYTDHNGLHCHTCPSCDAVWQHPTPPDDISRACHDRWHECPRCGAAQFDKTELAEVDHIDFPWQQQRRVA